MNVLKKTYTLLPPEKNIIAKTSTHPLRLGYFLERVLYLWMYISTLANSMAVGQLCCRVHLGKRV